MQVKINGQMIETEAGKTVFDAAFALDPAIAREALCCTVNGEVRELTYIPSEGDEVTTLTFEDEQARKVFWHTTSHVLAEAVKNLFPDAKLTIGPSIENGYYYDFDHAPFSREDLDKIEAEMKKIIKKGAKLEKFTLPREEAIKFMEEAIAAEESDAVTDAGYWFELAASCFKGGNSPKAFEAALKAAELDPAMAGKAYLLAGTIWGSQACPGNEIEQRAKYWVATDYMNKAKNADPSLAEDCNNYISQYKVYYPQTAEAFMYDVTDGQIYNVSCGGMRAVTTVRTQK